MSETITYEQPLNERIRTFLRLEFLFAKAEHAMQGDSEWENRELIECLASITIIFERNDLKSEIIKEIERLIETLAALANSHGVDRSRLDKLLSELDQNLDALLVRTSPVGQMLRDNEFLKSIRQRSSIPGGTCDFDLPAYHFWLQHTATEYRKQQLQTWLEQFATVSSAITICLRLIRSGSHPVEKIAKSGFYQQSFDNHQHIQLVRIIIPANANFFPEISGGKHRLSIRFMNFKIEQRAQQSTEEVPFLLNCCAM